MLQIYNYTIICNANIDKEYINKIDSAVLYDSNCKYIGGIIYYSDDLSEEPSLIIGLNKDIYFKSDDVTDDNINYICKFIDDNIDLIKFNINSDADDLIHFGKFEKL